jgi:transposase
MTIFIQPILQVVMMCVERHESLIWLCVATAVGGCILPLFLPREKRKRAVDRLSELCGARGDHVYRFGQVTYCTRTDKITRTRAMLNSGMGTRHNHQGTLRLFLPHLKEEKVIQRFHGIDRHKKLSTISVVSQEGQEIQFLPACWDLRKYIEDLGSEDAVILEVSSGAFWWADRIEAKGATCYILDPHRFRIIKDSWKKTDKYDARNMVKALWVHLVTGEFGIPSVYKPSGLTRELGKLFSQHELLNRQIRMLKNNIQAILLENGIVISRKEVLQLISPQEGAELLKELDISEASRTGIEVSQQLLWAVLEKKDRIQREILHTGEPLQHEIKRLITIRGITPLTALAFLADVGDVTRFKSLRKMNAYLGLVPRIKESGGKNRPGHINRESRKLTRTILAQSIHHVSNSSPYLRRVYRDLTDKRGYGRARVALIRRVCGISYEKSQGLSSRKPDLFYFLPKILKLF